MKYLPLLLLLCGIAHAEDNYLVTVSSIQSVVKWMPIKGPNRKYSFSRRKYDDTGFEPMVLCDENKKHCVYKISADEMMSELEMLWKVALSNDGIVIGN